MVAPGRNEVLPSVMQSTTPTGPDGERRGAIPDGLLGAVGAAMILLAVGVFLFGGPADGGVPTAPPPLLQLAAPAAGDTVPSTLQIHFTSTAPVTPMPGGWGAEGYHLHARLDQRELMPGPDDVRREGEGYVWTIPGVPPGERELSISWSDAAHRPLAETSTPSIVIVVR